MAAKQLPHSPRIAFSGGGGPTAPGAAAAGAPALGVAAAASPSAAAAAAAVPLRRSPGANRHSSAAAAATGQPGPLPTDAGQPPGPAAAAQGGSRPIAASALAAGRCSQPAAAAVDATPSSGTSGATSPAPAVLAVAASPLRFNPLAARLPHLSRKPLGLYFGQQLIEPSAPAAPWGIGDPCAQLQATNMQLGSAIASAFGLPPMFAGFGLPLVADDEGGGAAAAEGAVSVAATASGGWLALMADGSDGSRSSSTRGAAFDNAAACPAASRDTASGSRGGLNAASRPGTPPGSPATGLAGAGPAEAAVAAAAGAPQQQQQQQQQLTRRAPDGQLAPMPSSASCSSAACLPIEPPHSHQGFRTSLFRLFAGAVSSVPPQRGSEAAFGPSSSGNGGSGEAQWWIAQPQQASSGGDSSVSVQGPYDYEAMIILAASGVIGTDVLVCGADAVGAGVEDAPPLELYEPLAVLLAGAGAGGHYVLVGKQELGVGPGRDPQM